VPELSSETKSIKNACYRNIAMAVVIERRKKDQESTYNPLITKSLKTKKQQTRDTKLHPKVDSTNFQSS
jgi:hypothetical protein